MGRVRVGRHRDTEAEGERRGRPRLLQLQLEPAVLAAVVVDLLLELLDHPHRRRPVALLPVLAVPVVGVAQHLPPRPAVSEVSGGQRVLGCGRTEGWGIWDRQKFWLGSVCLGCGRMRGKCGLQPSEVSGGAACAGMWENGGSAKCGKAVGVARTRGRRRRSPSPSRAHPPTTPPAAARSAGRPAGGAAAASET